MKRASNCPESTLSSKASFSVSVLLKEKREKQVWNKRRQILYTVEKVGRAERARQDVHADGRKRLDKRNHVSLCSSPSALQMYSLLLEVQDFEKCFVQAPEEDREALLEQHKSNTEQLCSSLREKEWDDR